jgi:agmatinase
MKSTAIVFPFDLFGSSGTGEGACLLGDALREMMADAKREEKPSRSRAYRDQVRVKEFAFETVVDYTSWRKTARGAIRPLLKSNDFFFWLAGNHLGVLPIYEELEPEALVLQLDAHLDIYNLSDTTEELSHGNFLLHAEKELPQIVNFGHRDLFLVPEHVQQYYTAAYSAAEMSQNLEAILKPLPRRIKDCSRVFIDIDCDAFDPSYFPATPHPLPFGLAPAFALKLLQMIPHEKLAGIAISEFEPGRDVRDQSLGTLIWLLEWLLLRRYEEARTEN